MPVLTITQLVALLGQINQLAGDVPVLIHDATVEGEHIISEVRMAIHPETGKVSSVTLVRSAAPPPAAADQLAPAPGQDAG